MPEAMGVSQQIFAGLAFFLEFGQACRPPLSVRFDSRHVTIGSVSLRKRVLTYVVPVYVSVFASLRARYDIHS